MGQSPMRGFRVRRGCADGGLKVYDVSDRANPRLLVVQRTHGVGAHRFDVDDVDRQAGFDILEYAG